MAGKTGDEIVDSVIADLRPRTQSLTQKFVASGAVA
jgi:hypothetical protein